MELISQRTKMIMEECKTRARAFGLDIQGETLEYIVTNRNLLELSPKMMIPTLYDYWLDDVEVVRNKWIYDAYPHNPYETVINTRPPISYYNDNNPDWFNTMIFYHALGHIDCFQNNVFFQNTWHGDFCGEALADLRLINRIREEMGDKKRWVDYAIEFARSVDNLVGFYQELDSDDKSQIQNIIGLLSDRLNFYFGEFLRQRYDTKAVELKFYYDEIERLNACQKQFGEKLGESAFFDSQDFRGKFPEFNSVFNKQRSKKKSKSKDIFQHLMDHSEFINKEKNKWMKDPIGVVRRTSLYFQAQMRTKGVHEGWASLCHERLFLDDPRMRGHEIDYAKVNSGVVVHREIGLNPYMTYKLLFEFIEELAEKGKLSRDYQLIKDSEARKSFDLRAEPGAGKRAIFEARKNLDDFMLANFLSDDDFQDFVDRHNLFVAGRRFNPEKLVIEIYIKSRSGKEYRKMINDSLYHPPHIIISEEKAEEDELYLDHIFEGRTLVTRYIPAVLKGLSYLAGGMVRLETTEFEFDREEPRLVLQDPEYKREYKKYRVLYTCSGNDLDRAVISDETREE